MGRKMVVRGILLWAITYLMCPGFAFSYDETMRRVKGEDESILPDIASFETLEDYLAENDVRGKRVGLRVELNVPLERGKVLDLLRLREALPAVEKLIEKGAKVILVMHLGRPDGKVVEEQRVEPVIAEFEKMLGKNIPVGPDSIVGPGLRTLVSGMSDGDVISTQNVRFHPGEKTQDEQFAKAFLDDTDIELWVVDAAANMNGYDDTTMTLFSKLAQMKGIPSLLGPLVAREYTALDKFRAKVLSPVVGIFGGAKVDKLDIIKEAVVKKKVDKLIVVGAIAHAFLKSRGYELGQSLIAPKPKDVDNAVEEAGEIDRLALANNIEIIVPVDGILKGDIERKQPQDLIDEKGKPIPILPDRAIWDIGPKTIALIKEKLKGVKTVVLNGTAGKFEDKGFDFGTNSIIQALNDPSILKLVFGGEGAAAVNLFFEGLKAIPASSNFTVLSIGGAGMAWWVEKAEEFWPVFRYINRRRP